MKVVNLTKARVNISMPNGQPLIVDPESISKPVALDPSFLDTLCNIYTTDKLAFVVNSPLEKSIVLGRPTAGEFLVPSDVEESVEAIKEYLANKDLVDVEVNPSNLEAEEENESDTGEDSNEDNRGEKSDSEKLEDLYSVINETEGDIVSDELIQSAMKEVGIEESEFELVKLQLEDKGYSVAE